MTLIPKISALYESSLASALSASGTSIDVVSGSDNDGNALSGVYGFVIDEGSANEEFIIGSILGETITITSRGLDADDPSTEITSNKKVHSRGASIKITDYPILGFIRNLLNAEAGFTFPNPLRYAAAVNPSNGKDLVDKDYADSLTFAGAPLASETVAGRAEEATLAQIDADTGPGDVASARLFINPANLALSKYGTRLPTADEKAALNSNVAPSASNKFITQKGLQLSAERYAVDSAGTDTYAITLSPAPTAYAAGMPVNFKAGTANTAAATLNVNGLGAKSILRPDGSALANGDIAANQIVSVIYDGTNFLLTSPLANNPKFASIVATRDMTAASGAVTYAHGLGRAPRYVRVHGWFSHGNELSGSMGTYDGTTTNCIAFGHGTADEEISSTSDVIRLSSGAGDISAHNQAATVTVDATNVTLTWTKTGTPTNGGGSGARILIEVEA